LLKSDVFLEDQIINYPYKLIESPNISVIMPTFCRGDNGMLRRAIDSVLSQTYKKFELIIIDDGSTDSTAEIIKEYQKRDNRVLHIRHDQNCGLPALRVNEGLKIARGQYIAYQFDDDQWVPEALEKLLYAMESNSNDCLVYGKSIVTLDNSIIEVGEHFNYSKLINSNFIANNSVLHPKKFFELYGGYDPHILMRRLCDWDLWLRWSSKVPFVYADTVVSNVDAGLDNSIGQTVPFDAGLFRLVHSIDRNSWFSATDLYGIVLDDLEYLSNLISYKKKQQIYSLHILPFLLRHRKLLEKSNEDFLYSLPKKKNVLVTKYDYDSTINITINNFSEYLNDYLHCVYIPEIQVDSDTIEDYEVIVFHRTCDGYSTELLNTSLETNKTVCYLLDDDLLNIHELGTEFDYLKPGSVMHTELISQISSADSVISFSSVISDSIQQLNPRYVELSTNIKTDYLSKDNKQRMQDDKKMHIAFAGGSARKDEFKFLWPVLQKISKKYKDSLEFHFWGTDISSHGELESKINIVPFTSSYEEYMSRLVESNFDLMLAPLFDNQTAKKAKSPIKYLEITAAGSIGIYSDVLPYKAVIDGITGIKVQNDQDAWYKAIEDTVEMDRKTRLEMNNKARKHIKRNFLSNENKYSFMTALEGAHFHKLTRNKRGKEKKPAIAYFCHSPYLGGAENHLLRHAQLMNRYGVQPIWCLPEDFIEIEDKNTDLAKKMGFEIAYFPVRIMTEPNDFEVNENSVSTISSWLQENNIALVHSVTLMPELSAAVRKTEVPLITSLYALNARKGGEQWKNFSDFVHSDSVLYSNIWSRIFNTSGKCIRSWIPDDFFEIGIEKIDSGLCHGKKIRIAISGTLQERKGQLQAIIAIGELKLRGFDVELHLFGYTNFFPDYIEKCNSYIQSYGLENNVVLHGFNDRPTEYLREVDILLCASDFESLPQAILEGMAAGALIITTPVGGIPEVIIDNYSGIIIEDNDPENIINGILRAISMDEKQYSQIIKTAFELVHYECNSDRVAYELIGMYNIALDSKLTNKPTKEADRLDVAELHDKSVDYVYEDLDQGNLNLTPINVLRDKKMYLIQPSNSKWSGFSFMVGTHGKHLNGRIIINIYSKSNEINPIRTTELDMGIIEDNKFIDVIFEPIIESRLHSFIVEFIFVYENKNKKIAIYEQGSYGKLVTLKNKLKYKGNVMAGKLIYKC